MKTSYHIIIAITVAHLLNDLLQGVLTASYPQLQGEFALTMTQVGLITLCYQLAGSLFQPLVGVYTDKHPQPYLQVVGMSITALGLVVLSYATNYGWILCAVAMVGVGSSIFHPESSRVAYLAAGNRRSFSQSAFQLGGNMGASLAPLMIALVVIPYGRRYTLCFLGFALVAIVILFFIGRWKAVHLKATQSTPKKEIALPDLTKKQVRSAVLLLLLLIFSKAFYTSSITNYFQFYIIAKFHLTQTQAQVYLFYFLGAAALGTLLGGLLGDKWGRKRIIWFSILGAAPFALALPYIGQELTAVFIVLIGGIISSAFPAILVYAQELLPKKIGMVSGLFYGFAFGVGGLASVVLGKFIDLTNLDFVYRVCSFLPLIGLVAYFLPDLSIKKSS